MEGPDGCGKTTQTNMLKEHIMSKGYDVLHTREPGGTKISEKIRELVLGRAYMEMVDPTEVLLYAAARAQHVAEVVIPALEAGKVVLCDRFIDSSIAYQGYGREIGNKVLEINEYAIQGCMPKITFLLMLDPEEAKSRIAGEHDRIEVEKLEYHNRVYQGYIALSEKYPERIKRIDAKGTPGEVHERIKKYIDEVL